MSLYAVIRIRGTADVRSGTKATLQMLNLTKPNHVVIVSDTPVRRGMLLKCKDYVTWGEVDEKVADKLVQAKGMQKNTKEKNPYKGLVFQMAPPAHGLEAGGMKFSIKQGGSLGYRGAEINELLERMLESTVKK